MLSQIDVIRQALITATAEQYQSENVFHYSAYDKTPPYIVWAEDNEYDSVEADNHKVNQTIEGTIDLFTKTEDDPLIEGIQDALNNACISFRLNTVDYEEEAEFIHYEWVWQVSI